MYKIEKIPLFKRAGFIKIIFQKWKLWRFFFYSQTTHFLATFERLIKTPLLINSPP